MKSGFVYLICDSERDCYKIGVTTGKIENRLKKLQTGNGCELHIVDSFYTNNPFLMEKILHKVFFKSKKKNEWFNLNNDEVFSFKDECMKINDIIKNLKDNPFMKC